MYKKRSRIQVNDDVYRVMRVYEKRNGMQIFIVSDNKKLYMMKQYDDFKQYQKILEDYRFLEKLNINIPKVITTDDSLQIIVKDYITGPLASSLILMGKQPSYYLEQVKEMAKIVEENQKCLDYFPTNFIDHNHMLHYVHYECFDLEDKRLFENVVQKYWINSVELIELMNEKK